MDLYDGFCIMQKPSFLVSIGQCLQGNFEHQIKLKGA